MSEQPETNTTSKKNPSPTGPEASPVTKPPINGGEVLNLVHSAARAARLRIVDGRAREAMAIFEHELHYRIEAFLKERT